MSLTASEIEEFALLCLEMIQRNQLPEQGLMDENSADLAVYQVLYSPDWMAP